LSTVAALRSTVGRRLQHPETEAANCCRFLQDVPGLAREFSGQVTGPLDQVARVLGKTFDELLGQCTEALASRTRQAADSAL
jgi:hypothetical protein